MLLKGQGVTVERPSRTAGTAVGAAAAGLALILALALVLKALDWPVSFPGFLAWSGAAVLLLLAVLFAFWAYSCFSLRYVLGGGGITVNWGLVKHFIAINEVNKLVAGRGEQRPRVNGLSWYGYHVGRGNVEGIGDALFFSTHTSPEELVYVMTGGATYALSPRDPVRFIAQAQRLQEAGGSQRKSGVQRDFLSSHPVFADHTAQFLALAAVVLNVALWGFLMAVYPDLDKEISIEFPPVGDITGFHERSEILKIPATATAILATNLLAGLAFEWKERAATYLLLSGAIFFQAAFWIAAIVALINA
ncbi:MAG TPA: PH domain-containing protein [Dehalococcoidia bacterium]|nr:PH domain-containing protein [Dehalococcoidia bacterium]